jgi:hypothetical protein
MSDARPTVSPQLVATVIESAPDRVRRRLDRTPDAAAGWEWRLSDDGWSVDTGGEMVRLPPNRIQSLDQVSCTCLLTPNCFHVLAILTALRVALANGAEAVSADDEVTTRARRASEADGPEGTVLQEALSYPSHRIESATTRQDEDLVQPTATQQRAAGDLTAAVAQLLRVGVANAGVVVQSGLLRAVHQCRAEGLHRAAAVGLRVLAGTSQFRARSPESDPAELAADVADLLETTQQILHQASVPSFWIGTARRKQLPVRPRKLHGLLAEPIVTRSGYAGAAAYFLGEDDQIYTASDVRPGDAQLARDAYLGGIEIGPLVQPAKQLARGAYLGTDLTASRDGRLGRGKNIKLVAQGASGWQVEAIRRRFQRPLVEQWNLVYDVASLPADARPAGWDFVFLTGKVLGAFGPQLFFHLTAEDRPIRLAIENESETLCFRENLRMFSHAPGLPLQIIARLNLPEPAIVYPLAAANAEPGSPDADSPRLDLPESLHGRLCLGFDELQRKHLIHARPAAVVLGELQIPAVEDPLASLHRRWIAALLSGVASQRPSNTNTITAETAMLHRRGYATGAALLDATSRPPSAEGPNALDTFLAVSLYLRSCRHALAKSKAAYESF